MFEFLVSITTLSTDGLIPNIFEFLKPFAALAGNVKDLIGLAPTLPPM